MRGKQDYNLLSDGITHSVLSAWLRCRQECKYYLEGWASLKPKEALSFGSMFHGMLQVVYDQFRLGKVPKSLSGLQRASLERAQPWLETYVEQMSRRTSQPDFIEMLDRHAAICEAMLPLFLKRWEDDFRSREWVQLESEFRIPHSPGEADLEVLDAVDGVILRGKRDGLFRKVKGKGKSKKLWLLETKTKSRIEADMMDELLINSQNLFYMWATRLETGEMPVGVDYNIVRRPSIRQQDGETNQDYAERIAEDVAQRPSTYFVRMEVAYAAKDVLYYADQLSRKLAEFRAWSEDQEHLTYRNEGSCIGRWSCDFLRACSSGSMKGYVQTRLFRELG